MGRSRRPRPARLAAKLRQIRLSLNLTQEQMFRRLGDTKTALYEGHITEYESGRREPPIQVLLRYARVAGVPMEMLADDELELPDHLPAPPEVDGVMRRRRARG